MAIEVQDNRELNDKIKKYLQLEKNNDHKKYIETLVRENNISQLKRLIGKRLLFGTAGIRGSMGAGFGQMNDLVIIQTSQGLASYLLEYDKQACLTKGVIIGFDARHNSARFARLTALAFLHKQIPVYFSDYIIATPLIAYGVIKYNCAAGIVITASHNPKHDNGYKVYWSNGAQILSPHDAEIQRHIMMEDNQVPWLPFAWKHEILLNNNNNNKQAANEQQSKVWCQKQLLFRIYKDLSGSYFDYIDSMINDGNKLINQSSNISITYTTMHGVGHTFLTKALELANFNDIYAVELQKKPDPEFSTVKFPNPEEAGALDLAFETARHANSNLILANDPDADRCAAAIYEPKTGYKRVLNGNEIGSLLGWWLWHCFINNFTSTKKDDDDDDNDDVEEKKVEGEEEEVEDQNGERKKLNSTISVGSKDNDYLEKPKPNDCYMISTAVSSKFLYSMALIEGFHFVETLTGFKYMGNVADSLIKESNKKVLFAYEEAIGYMCDSRVLDKDGISAAVQLAQCAAYVSLEYNRTLEQHLDWLYTKYGYHYNINSYYLCTDQQIIKEIFTNIQKNYPKEFKSNENVYRIKRIRDLNNNYDSGTKDHKATLPSSSSSYMITFFIEDNITFTIRTSGTEPKIKYYSEIVSKLPPLKVANNDDIRTKTNINIALYDEMQLAAKESAKEKLKTLIELAVEHCLQPSRYNLEPAAD